MGWSVFKSDSFNRADSGSIGSDWPSGAADFSIVSNQCVLEDTVADHVAMWSSPAGDFTVDSTHYPDQSSSALIYCSGFGFVAQGPGVMVRQNVSGLPLDCYRLVVSGASGVSEGIELARFVAGSYTSLATYTNGAFTWVNGARLTLRVTGQNTATVLEVIYNGVSLGTYNDTSGFARNTGQPGLAYSSEVTGTNKWDDWEGGIFTADAVAVALTSSMRPFSRHPKVKMMDRPDQAVR